MSLLHGAKLLRELYLFEKELNEYPQEVLDKIKDLIYQEEKRRAEVPGYYPPMLDAEFKLSKVQAIRAYRTRVNCSLVCALRVWERTRREDSDSRIGPINQGEMNEEIQG